LTPALAAFIEGAKALVTKELEAARLRCASCAGLKALIRRREQQERWAKLQQQADEQRTLKYWISRSPGCRRTWTKPWLSVGSNYWSTNDYWTDPSG
jgi:hypothetical protein